jgi:hypothetical protein
MFAASTRPLLSAKNMPVFQQCRQAEERSQTACRSTQTANRTPERKTPAGEGGRFR